jgi:PPOX class probable F420-dependent enzyme
VTADRLGPDDARLLAEARTAVLATVDPLGRPRTVPVCFVADFPIVYTPLDEKPKRDADPHGLARVRDIEARPEVTLLVECWDEDWRRLAWLRLHGRATLLEPSDEAAAEERRRAIATLRAKYRQYADHDLESRPIIRIEVTEVVAWSAAGAAPRP